MANQQPFDKNSYYRLVNNVYPNNTLSTIGHAPLASLNMTLIQQSGSSENWQLYYQSPPGVYFFRNYDAGGKLQLGLTPDSRAVPRLLNRSGDFGQQWLLNRGSDGKYRITNMLVSNSAALGLVRGMTVPGMDTSDEDCKWDISINVSAGSPTDPDMLTDVVNVQKANTSSPAIALTSTSTTKPLSTSASSTTSPTASHRSDLNSSKISSGAIAGIVVGVVVFAVILALLAFFFWRRRRRITASKLDHATENPVIDHSSPHTFSDAKVVTPEPPPAEKDATPKSPAEKDGTPIPAAPPAELDGESRGDNSRAHSVGG